MPLLTIRHAIFLLVFCGSTSAPSFLSGADATLTELQFQAAQTILGDPALVRKVLSLAQDPGVQAVLHDPKLMEAVQNGNLELLARHPAILQLMAHPVVQEISNKPKPAPVR